VIAVVTLVDAVKFIEQFYNMDIKLDGDETDSGTPILTP
jgi:hypothetical protein